jgi:hypothetical protein
LIDVLVGAIDDGPGGEEGGLEAVLPEVIDGGAGGGADFGGEFVGAGGDDAVAVALEHRERAIDEVAEAIGQFGGVTGSESGVGPIAVGADIEFADDVIAEGIGAPFVDDGDGIDDVAGAFAHALAVLLPPAVGEDFFGEGEAHGFEHDGPIDGVEFEDILAEDLDVGGPEFRAGGLVWSVAGRR